MSLQADLLFQFLDQLTKMITSREQMINWVEEFIQGIKNQEIAVNTSKTGAAVTGTIAAIGLFTPFAPLAAAGLLASAGVGVTTSICDLIATKVKGGNLEEKFNEMKREEFELQKLQELLDQPAEILAKELQISKEDARLFVLFAVPKAVAQAGISVVQGQVEIIKILPHLTAISGAMKLGASFSEAISFSATVFTGVRASVDVARVGTAFATAARVLGGLGAVIGIADAVYSWSTKNPNRASAEELLPQLKSNLESLKKTKKELLQLKEQIDN